MIINTIIILHILFHRKWMVGNPPMGGWEPKSYPPFWVTQLRGYAVTHMLLYNQLYPRYVAFLSGYEFTTRLESRACEIKAVFSIGLVRNGVSWVRISLQY